jgi:hypothetical protein
MCLRWWRKLQENHHNSDIAMKITKRQAPTACDEGGEGSDGPNCNGFLQFSSGGGSN